MTNGIEKLYTIAELAAYKNVSMRTIRQLIANLDIDPDDYVANTQGSKTPLYTLSKLELQSSSLQDIEAVQKLSDAGKLKFMIGSIELEGTVEQKAKIRAYIDSKDNEIKQLTSKLQDEIEYNNNIWKQSKIELDRVLLGQRKIDAEAYENLFNELRKLRRRLGLDEFTGHKVKLQDED
jgi:phenylalanyl-tRNA synthetase alpha subunit